MINPKAMSSCSTIMAVRHAGAVQQAVQTQHGQFLDLAGGLVARPEGRVQVGGVEPKQQCRDRIPSLLPG